MNTYRVPQDRVFEYLNRFCQGHARAVKAQALAELFSTSIREINKEVSMLRKEGKLVGSSKEAPYGYFIPVTEDEIRGYLDAFKGELFDMLATYNIQKRAARRSHDQKAQPEFISVSGGQLAFV